MQMPFSLILSWGLALSCAALSPAAVLAAPSALTVTVAPPKSDPWPDTVAAGGWLRPANEVIVASESAGLRVAALHADVGQWVKAGDVLANLADDTLRADLAQQDAAVAAAQAAYDLARGQALRARQVAGSGALSDQQVSDYLNSETTARTSLDQAVAKRDSAAIALKKAVIVAQVDGVVASKSAQLGGVVAVGTELFRLIDGGRIEWQAEVAPRYLPKLRPGLAATIPTPDGDVAGVVRLVEPTVDTDTGRALVHVDVTPGPGAAAPRSGLFVSGAISLGAHSALHVPQTAIVLRDGFSYVFTVDDQHIAHRLRVETGRRQGSEVEILSGLTPDAAVVQEGGAFLSDGATVSVVGG